MIGADTFRFEVTARDAATRARTGRLVFARGEVETPAFLPVGTQGTVKAITPWDLEATGTSMILSNTYHLALRPGAEVVREAGGLHAFMGWRRPILTDSGGFQVFSLASCRTVDDEGVTFRSHIDGDLIRLTPERSIEIQNALGSDVAMVFDECPPAHAERTAVEVAVSRTLCWAERSVRAHRRGDQALFGIVQGGLHEDLRRACAARIVEMGFPGHAIGGVAVGEGPAEMRRVVDLTAPLLPEGRPRYVMGVGGPSDLVDMVASGVDLFDCVIPTRHARNASLFVPEGLLKMRNERHERDFGPVDPSCSCPTCRGFSRAYLRHLYQRGEMLAGMLGTIHNLTFFQRLLAEIRAAVRNGRIRELQAAWRAWGREADDAGAGAGSSAAGPED